MMFDSLKKMLSRGSNSAARDSTKERTIADDVMSGVSILEQKLNQLNKFRQACMTLVWTWTLRKPLSQHMYSLPNCLAFANARRASDETTHAMVSQYEEVRSNLMTLALSANAAGINLQTETRTLFEAINDLMQTMGLGRD